MVYINSTCIQPCTHESQRTVNEIGTLPYPGMGWWRHSLKILHSIPTCTWTLSLWYARGFHSFQYISKSTDDVQILRLPDSVDTVLPISAWRHATFIHPMPAISDCNVRDKGCNVHKLWRHMSISSNPLRSLYSGMCFVWNQNSNIPRSNIRHRCKIVAKSGWSS